MFKFKSILKKGSLLILTLSLLGTVSGNVLASTPMPAALNESQAVDSNQVLSKLSNSENKLIDYLKTNSGKKDINLLVDDYFYKYLKSPDKFTADELNSLNDISKKNIDKKALATNNDKRYISTPVTKVVQINDSDIQFYDNGMFSIGKTAPVDAIQANANTANNSMSIMSTTYNRYAQTYRDYYSWCGLRIFSVGQQLNFWYNYSSAGYNGGYNAYHNKGSIVTVWQYNDWYKGTTQVGTKLEASCGGYFHTGFEYKGFGWVVDDLNVNHTLTCYPDGSYTARYSAI